MRATQEEDVYVNYNQTPRYIKFLTEIPNSDQCVFAECSESGVVCPNADNYICAYEDADTVTVNPRRHNATEYIKLLNDRFYPGEFIYCGDNSLTDEEYFLCLFAVDQLGIILVDSNGNRWSDTPIIAHEDTNTSWHDRGMYYVTQAQIKEAFGGGSDFLIVRSNGASFVNFK